MNSAPPTLTDRFTDFCRQYPGAESIDDVLTPEQKRQLALGTKVADFFFENRTIICELKSLTKDTSGKLVKFMTENGLDPSHLPPGEHTIEDLFVKLPNGEALLKKAMDSLTAPIADGFDEAERQIRDTKKLFNIASADGLLVILNGAVDIAGPSLIRNRIQERLSKTAADGTSYHKDVTNVLHIGEKLVPASFAGDQSFNMTLPNPLAIDAHGVHQFVYKFAEAWAKFNGHTFSVAGSVIQEVIDAARLVIRVKH